MRFFAQSKPSSLRFTVRDEDGVATDATSAPSVTIYDDAGLTVQTGTATDAGDGFYTFALGSLVRDVLGVYTVDWVYTLTGQVYSSRDQFEVVSDYLFDVADLRAYDVAVEDDERYTAEMIRVARDAATQRMENAGDIGFVQHARRVVVDGSGRVRLMTPDVRITEVMGVWIDGVEIDPDEILIQHGGVLYYEQGWTAGINNVEVRYVHGWEATPEPVREAAKMLASEYLVKSALPSRATAQSTDLGEFRITVANVDAGRDIGIPDVDAVIIRYGARRPKLG